MTEDQPPGKHSETQARRATRLAEELRANLQKRKAQIRSRRSGEADLRREGVAVEDGVERDAPKTS